MQLVIYISVCVCVCVCVCVYFPDVTVANLLPKYNSPVHIAVLLNVYLIINTILK